MIRTAGLQLIPKAGEWLVVSSHSQGYTANVRCPRNATELTPQAQQNPDSWWRDLRFKNTLGHSRWRWKGNRQCLPRPIFNLLQGLFSTSPGPIFHLPSQTKSLKSTGGKKMVNLEPVLMTLLEPAWAPQIVPRYSTLSEVVKALSCSTCSRRRRRVASTTRPDWVEWVECRQVQVA